MNFKLEILANFEVFFGGEGVKFVRKLFVELLKLHSHFRLKLKVEGKIGYFPQEMH